MAYRYGNRSQLTFLPEAIDSYVGEEDPVRVYDAFIDALSSKDLEIILDERAVGNASYDPITMLKILVYGYSYGWRSSRKLERALHHNLSFIWLAGGLKPDHKTISNFRSENKEILKNVLKQCARMCVKLGLIQGNTLFVDGSKFRANAGKSQTKSVETWEKYRQHIERRIEKLLEECHQTDEDEKEKDSLVKINKDLKSKERLKKKIDNLLKEIQPSPSMPVGKETINGTDPDCQIMKSHQGSHSGYNSQIVADDAFGLLVSTDVNTSKNDLNELNKQVGKAEETLEKPADKVCADAGYSSVDDIKPLVDEGKTVIVPNSKQAQKVSKEERFSKDAFLYNPDRDTYICPNGEEMYRSNYDENRNRLGYRMKKPSACRSCVHFGECTCSRSGRRIYRLVNETIKEKLEKAYESEDGQQLFARRKMRVEHPFGHIKRNLGAGAFLLRGLDGVNAELSLLGTCFNIARLITIMGGVRPLIENLKRI